MKPRRLVARALVAGALLLLLPYSVTARQAPDKALTLTAAIAEALAGSPELAARTEAVRFAEIGARLSQSEFAFKFSPTISTGTDPLIGTTRNAGVSVTKRLATGAQISGNFSSTEYGTEGRHFRDTGYTIGVAQPLLRGFQRTATAGVTASKRAIQSAERDREQARASLAVRVTRQFFEILKQQRFKAAAGKTAERATRLRIASEARVQVGLATELDVLRARILASQSAAAAASADGAVAGATDQLALLIGRAPHEPLSIASSEPTLVEALEPLPESEDELMTAALASRGEIREALDQAADRARVASVARWNLLPPVALDVSYTQRGLGARDSGLHSLLSGWRVGLTTSYSLDRAAEAAAASTAQIAATAASERARDVEQRIIAEVRQIHRAWRTATSTLAIHVETVGLAERELELAELRFQRGLASSLDVVGAETNLLQAENARIAAELDRTVLALDLRRAIGRLDLETLVADGNRP